MRAAGREFIAPGEFGAVEPAAGGELPLGLGRQGPCRPSRIGRGVLKATWTAGWSSRPSMVLPGLRVARQAPGVQRHQLEMSRVSTGPSVMRKTRAPGASVGGIRARIEGGVERPLGDGHMPGRGDEGGELSS